MDIFYRKKIHRTDGTEVEYIEGGCLSTETKPVEDFALVSKMIEADTGMVYFFAGKTAQPPWVPQFTFKQD